jgi:hypothetical protein
MKKIVIWMTAIVILLSAAFAAYGEATLSKNLTSQEMPSYAGFSEIDPAKNYFILIGDTQATSHWEFWRERNDQQRKLILEEIGTRQPAFVVHLGDLTVRGSSKKHWQEFDDLHKAWREKKIPCFPILGNHEFYGNDQKSLDYYFGRFPYLERRRWYSFIWKNLGLILFDSNLSTLTPEEKTRQKRWYLSELERFEKDENIDSVIVCCHEPPFTNSRVVGPNKQVEDNFANPFLRFSKTSFFFSGHAHTYERFELEGKSFIVSGGGGGPRHKVNIDPVKRRYPDLFLGPELRFFHACEIERSDRALIYKVLRLEPDSTFSVIDPVIVDLSHRR